MCDIQEKTAENIAGYFEDILPNPTERAKELVEYLEKTEFLEKEFQLSKVNTRLYKDITLRYQKFCKTYLMKVFLEFIPNEEDAELILMMYGFIQNYDHTKKSQRYEAYWEHARKYNAKLDRERKDKGHRIREVKNTIMAELANALATIVVKSGGKLNFAEEVLEAFSNNEIPEKLKLPITGYFHRTAAHSDPTKNDGVSKKDGKGKNIKLPTLTGLQRGRRHGSKQKGNKKSKKYFNRINIVFHTYLIAMPTDERKVKKSKRLIWFSLMVIALIVLRPNLAKLSFSLFDRKSATSGTVAENEAEVPHVEKILISESEIFITPDLGAQIMAAVWPPGAYPSEPSFQSSNTDIVTVARDGELKAECSPAEGESYTATITIQAGKITEYITVTVFSSKDYPEAKEEPEVKPRDDIEKP